MVTAFLRDRVLTKKYVEAFGREYRKATVARIVSPTTSKKSRYRTVPQTDTGSQEEYSTVRE